MFKKIIECQENLSKYFGAKLKDVLTPYYSFGEFANCSFVSFNEEFQSDCDGDGDHFEIMISGDFKYDKFNYHDFYEFLEREYRYNYSRVKVKTPDFQFKKINVSFVLKIYDIKILDQ